MRFIARSWGSRIPQTRLRCSAPIACGLLRNKETRTKAEEDEMNNLRRQVNEDLLAKGPVDAQSERYSELMHRFLISLESDLSQDGA